jgi:hypothetical protein
VNMDQQPAQHRKPGDGSGRRMAERMRTGPAHRRRHRRRAPLVSKPVVGRLPAGRRAVHTWPEATPASGGHSPPGLLRRQARARGVVEGEDGRQDGIRAHQMRLPDLDLMPLSVIHRSESRLGPPGRCWASFPRPFAGRRHPLPVPHGTLRARLPPPERTSRPACSLSRREIGCCRGEVRLRTNRRRYLRQQSAGRRQSAIAD